MTICLAAIGKEKNDEFIVFATDHMVTTAMGQFEHSIVKYRLLNKNTVAMLAGNPLIFDELVRLSGANLDFETIRQEIFGNFKKKRKEIIKNEIFDTHFIDEKFFIDALKVPIPNPFIETMLRQVSEFKLDTGILLIGFDKGGKAKIAEIDEGGTADFRDMNFHAIGSGNVQAANTLLFQKHDKCANRSSTLYEVYKSKRNAEVLQGVGKETELLILKQNGCYKIDENSLQILNEIYQNELDFGKKHKNLSKVRLGEKLKCF